MAFDICTSIVGVVVMMGTLFLHWEPRLWLAFLGFIFYPILGFFVGGTSAMGNPRT